MKRRIWPVVLCTLLVLLNGYLLLGAYVGRMRMVVRIDDAQYEALRPFIESGKVTFASEDARNRATGAVGEAAYESVRENSVGVEVHGVMFLLSALALATAIQQYRLLGWALEAAAFENRRAQRQASGPESQGGAA